MQKLKVNDRVRVIHGVPNDYLPAGAVGVIQSIWGEPEREYEVEFRLPDTSEPVREVLEADQIELIEAPPPAHLSEEDATLDRYEDDGGVR